MRVFSWQGGVLAALLLSAVWWARPHGVESPPAPPAQAAVASAPARAAAASAEASLPTDVDVDGAVAVDANGRLIADLPLRHLLEHFIAQAGDSRGLGQARVALAAHLAHLELVPGALAAALEAFDRYVAYLQAAQAVGVTGGAAADREAALDSLAHLRREYLGQELAEAFFAEEEAYDRFAIELRRLQADDGLTAEARAEQERLLAEQLPLELQQARERALELLRLEEQTQALRAGVADATAIYDLRVQRVGPEAAERLRRLDDEDAAWEARLADYRAARAHIVGGPGLDPADRERALDELRERRFSESERIRVQALDRIADLE